MKKIDRSITKESAEALNTTVTALRRDGYDSVAEAYREKLRIQSAHIWALEILRSRFGSMYVSAFLDTLDQLIFEGWTPPNDTDIQFVEVDE